VEVVAVPNGGATANMQPLVPIGQTTAGITAPGVYAFPPIAGDYAYAVFCSAFTSGSAAATLSAMNYA
jgi:hypothetical protein